MVKYFVKYFAESLLLMQEHAKQIKNLQDTKKNYKPNKMFSLKHEALPLLVGTRYRFKLEYI